MVDSTERKGGVLGFVACVWKVLWRPSVRYPVAVLAGGGVVAGILFWGGFHWALEITNTEAFCVSCHEMRDNPYKELKTTVHFKNRTGVRATCPDCHVPKIWQYKIARKIQASNELLHKALGTIDTPEKYAAQRLTMAMSVWDGMKRTDSRECRNCHDFASMDAEVQVRPAKRKHAAAIESKQTCIDCHQGIAHDLPKDWKQAWSAKWAK